MTAIPPLRKRLADSRGQSLVEFALVLPFLLLLAFGVVDIGYLLLDQHVVAKLAREGSNLISRDTTLGDAVGALKSMTSPPVDFDSRSSVVFSVLKKGATVGTGNYDRIFLYQRHSSGAMAAASRLALAGSGSFGGPPYYQAVDSDNATGLRVTNVPANLIVPRGGTIYVTEIFTTHDLLTPLGSFGVPVPTTLYSIAYF
jgi:hypothetical protein